MLWFCMLFCCSSLVVTLGDVALSVDVSVNIVALRADLKKFFFSKTRARLFMAFSPKYVTQLTILSGFSKISVINFSRAFGKQKTSHDSKGVFWAVKIRRAIWNSSSFSVFLMISLEWKNTH